MLENRADASKKNFTIETRLKWNPDVMAYFKSDIKKQSKLFRIVWKLVQTSGLKQSKLNTYLQNKNHIDKRTANTLIQSAKGRLSALKALKDTELADLRNKIGAIEKRIDELKVLVADDKELVKDNILKGYRLIKYRRNKQELWQKTQKLNRLRQKASKIERGLKEPVLPLCWGGKKAFKAQYNLGENGFKTHEAWRNWYRLKRDGQINFVGSIGEPQGNQNSQLNFDGGTGYFSLKVRKDLELMADANDKFFVLDKLEFKYQRDKLIETVKNDKTPLAARVLRRGNKWYLQIIFTWEAADIQTNRLYGAIGLDYNVGFIELSETDYYGNLVYQEHVGLEKHGSGNKAKSEIQEKVSAIVKQALNKKKPIAVEDLNFKKKKAGRLPGAGKRYNAILHAIDYSRYKDVLENAAFRNNVGLIYVDPAYTSKIGVKKYQEKKKLNRHQAASYVIARKGQGYIDKWQSNTKNKDSKKHKAL